MQWYKGQDVEVLVALPTPLPRMKREAWREAKVDGFTNCVVRHTRRVLYIVVFDDDSIAVVGPNYLRERERINQ